MFSVLEKKCGLFLVEMYDMFLRADPKLKKFHVWRKTEENGAVEEIYSFGEYFKAKRVYDMLLAAPKKAPRGRIGTLLLHYLAVKPDATVKDFSKFLKIGKIRGLI